MTLSSLRLRILKRKIWKALDDVIDFKDPPVPVERFLGICQKPITLPDRIVQMTTSAKEYLNDAVKEYLKESGRARLADVPCPSIDDRFDTQSRSLGKFASTAASHLMIFSMLRGYVEPTL